MGRLSIVSPDTRVHDGWSVTRTSTSIFVSVDDGDRVEAIELASPGHGIAGGDQVVFDDVDLFIDEADVLIAKLEAAGIGLTEGDDGCTTTAPRRPARLVARR